MLAFGYSRVELCLLPAYSDNVILKGFVPEHPPVRVTFKYQGLPQLTVIPDSPEGVFPDLPVKDH